MRNKIDFHSATDVQPGQCAEGDATIVDTNLGSFLVPSKAQAGDVLVLDNPYRLILLSAIDRQSQLGTAFRLVNWMHKGETEAHAAFANRKNLVPERRTP